MGKVWYLIVSIPDSCCLSYFYKSKSMVNHFVGPGLGPNGLQRLSGDNTSRQTKLKYV